MPASRRYVVCGPPDCGKTAWVGAHVQPFDLVWDFDAAVRAIVANSRSLRHEAVPDFVVDLMRDLRSALIYFCTKSTLPAGAGVFVIVTDRQQAERIAGALNAELVDLGERVSA